MTSALPSESAFKQALRDIDDGAKGIQDGANECINTYENKSWWSEFTMWLMGVLDKVGDALRQLSVKIAELGSVLLQMASPGNPFSMLERAAGWNDVKRIVDGQDGELDSGMFPLTFSWEGRDGWAYQSIINQQRSALSGFMPKAGDMSQHLSDHALGVIDGWTNVAFWMLEIQVDFYKNVSEFVSLDPTKWLDIVPSIVALVGDLILKVAEAIEMLKDYALDTMTAMIDLNGDLSTLTGSRSGVWPEANFE